MKQLFALFLLASITAAIRPLDDLPPLNQLYDAPRFVSKDSHNHAENQLYEEAKEDIKLAKDIAQDVKPKKTPKETSPAGEKRAEAEMKLTEQKLMETEGEASSIAAQDTKDPDVKSIQMDVAKQLVSNAQKDKSAAQSDAENANRESSDH